MSSPTKFSDFWRCCALNFKSEKIWSCSSNPVLVSFRFACWFNNFQPQAFYCSLRIFIAQKPILTPSAREEFLCTLIRWKLLTKIMELVGALHARKNVQTIKIEEEKCFRGFCLEIFHVSLHHVGGWRNVFSPESFLINLLLISRPSEKKLKFISSRKLFLDHLHATSLS